MRLRRFFAVFKNPLVWIVNLSAACFSWKYWDCFSPDNVGWMSGTVTLFSIVMLTLSSFVVYLRNDKSVREFLRENGARPFFTTNESLKTVSDNPLLMYLFEKSSVPKFASAIFLSSVWTFAFLAIVLATPSDLAASAYLVKLIAWVGLGVSSIIWISISVRLGSAESIAKNKWFSLCEEQPKNSYAPTGTVNGEVLCKSPVPVANWGGKKYYVCQISALNGPKMPTNGEVRGAIQWTYIES